MKLLLDSEIDCYFIKPEKYNGSAIIEDSNHNQIGWIGQGPSGSFVAAVGLYEHAGPLVLNVKEKNWSVRTYELFDRDGKLLGTTIRHFVLSSKRKGSLSNTRNEPVLQYEEPDIRSCNDDGKKIAHFTRGKESWTLKIFDLDYDRKFLFGLTISMNFSELKTRYSGF